MTHFIDYGRKRMAMPESTKVLIKDIKKRIRNVEREIREFEKIMQNKDKYTYKQRMGIKKLLRPAKSKIKNFQGIIKLLEQSNDR